MLTDHGGLRTDGVPLDALLRLQVMPLRDLFFSLISNLTSFPICIPRVSALGDIYALKNSQIYRF